MSWPQCWCSVRRCSWRLASRCSARTQQGWATRCASSCVACGRRHERCLRRFVRACRTCSAGFSTLVELKGPCCSFPWFCCADGCTTQWNAIGSASAHLVTQDIPLVFFPVVLIDCGRAARRVILSSSSQWCQCSQCFPVATARGCLRGAGFELALTAVAAVKPGVRKNAVIGRNPFSSSFPFSFLCFS